MALPDLTVLDQFKPGGFPPDFATNRRTFYSPVDDVHGALKAVVSSTVFALTIAMYGFDDDELAQIIFALLDNPAVTVTLTLDSSQAGGVHEKKLLASHGQNGNSIAIGRSEKGAIMHMKGVVVDGLTVVKGSTNWSDGGESKQDNEASVVNDRAEAAEFKARIDAVHAHMVAAAAPSLS